VIPVFIATIIKKSYTTVERQGRCVGHGVGITSLLDLKYLKIIQFEFLNFIRPSHQAKSYDTIRTYVRYELPYLAIFLPTSLIVRILLWDQQQHQTFLVYTAHIQRTQTDGITNHHHDDGLRITVAMMKWLPGWKVILLI
jgi:hypothetical protein